jgi:CHAT domain-containing protein
VESALGGVETVAIVPDPVMAQVPFAALRDEAGDYLIERFALTLQASATAFAAAPGVRRPTSELIVAAPRTPLPLAVLDPRREIAAAEHAVPHVRVIRGEEATASALLQDASRFDAVHLSMHAFEDEQRGEPVLALAADEDRRDGLLGASEIESASVRPGALVVLAACRTGAGRTSVEGTLSLARAFAAAGAGSVVATLWDADDLDAGPLFTRFYAELAAGASPATALRRAQLALLRANPRSDIRKWAVYQTYGGD